MAIVTVTKRGIYIAITRARYRGDYTISYIHYTTQLWMRVCSILLARYVGDWMAFIPIRNGSVSIAITQELLFGDYMAVSK
jgi:hypothetical protein